MEKDKNRIDDYEDVKSKESPEVNNVNKPNDAPPAMNSDNDPSVNWHLESGEKINDYH